MRRPVLARHPSLLLILVLLVTAACGDDETPTTPTTPTPTTVSETFEGTLTQNGGATHAFNTAAGPVTATLVTLGPDNTVSIGLSIGTFNTIGACQIVIANDNAFQGAAVVGQANAAGTLCVRLQDNGRLTQASTYVVRVDHP
jgi:hypothetical protein